jgi:Alpha/beta hydrolase domain
MRARLAVALVAALLGTGVSPAASEVVRVVVDRREDVLGGREWGTFGAYEKLVGRIYFAFDPDNAANRAVVDLRYAPRDAEGKVEAWAEFMVLQPKDPAKRRGVAWLEVANRGGKASLRYFNRAPRGALDPATQSDFGDGLLFRQGLTVIWVGWQWDVPDEEGLLRLHVPMARPGDAPITGLVRADWTVDGATDVLGLSHRGHRPYAASEPLDSANVLTVRDGREAPRHVIPRDRWDFLAPPDGPDAGRLTYVHLDGGFQAGKIYELVYRAQDPRVVGLGLAAIRDVASYAKYQIGSEFPVQHVVAFGVSQTGRFLRHYLYQGFNADEHGRRAVDGMLVHAAGAGRGSFNHRFAQPSRDAHRYSAFFYPTDVFPFTSAPEKDPVTGEEDGLMSRTREELRPRVFFTNSGYEYWGRAASLVHTSPDGTADVEPLPTERIYHLAGGQHSVGPFPPPDGSLMGDGPAYRGDPLDYLPTLRALCVRLVGWVADGTEPPASRYPHLRTGTLVPPSGLAFPRIPGVGVARVTEVAYRADYGPRFADQGIVDKQPPVLGPAFPALVPQVDGLGNELGGVREVELRVPVATYAPWNLRVGYVAARDELVDFAGTWIPLPRDEAGRATAGDPRPSLEALYPDKGAYLALVRRAAADLASDGFLLADDEATVVARAAALWDWVQAHGGH